ncbi:MAG TPA: amino acid permease [Planctomycetota bacterium]|nr:amino acid permease [Planctomycetota bacterium]HRR82241.1 amino acid permease [Planctomycetota bacterium]HRT95176.1 amino acid permease [Planctomycetota bacterium]
MSTGPSAAGPAPRHVAGSATQGGGAEARIGLWDCISIIVGIVIGVSIFKVPGLIFSNVSGPWVGLAAWLLGGALSLIGALCYAELATAYPKMGGDYAYLTRAYHPAAGFLFGWGRLSAIQTGSMGALAYVFADYAVRLFGGSDADLKSQAVWFALGAVVVLTLINLLGVMFGKGAQNVLTAAKVLGLLGILVAGFLWGKGGAFTIGHPVKNPDFGFAMILILYAYGGWNDSALVAAEVREPRRNLPRALLLGTVAITVIYLLVNLAYLAGLGFDGIRNTWVPAADVLKPMLGEWGSKGMCLLVILSALGALNGVILTGSRVHAAVGADYRLFAALGRWHRRSGAPVWALITQGAVTILMILAVGTEAGRNAFDQALSALGAGKVPWEKYFGGFDTLVAGTAPVFWLFFLLSGVSVIVLRLRDRAVERPFRVPLFPVFPIVFCLTCGYMLYSSVTYAEQVSLFGLVPLAVGVPLYLLSGGPGSGTARGS